MVQAFINYQKSVRGLSARTLEEYEKDLRLFASWVKTNIPGCTWSNMTMTISHGYVAYMTAEGLKPTTIKRRIAAIRCYSRWQWMSGRRSEDWARFTQTPRKQDTLPEVADTETVREYLKQPARHEEERILKAAVALMLTTGTRISETISISTDDINKKDQSITIKGKGGKVRKVYYQRETAVYLNKQLGSVKGKLFAGWSADDIRILMRTYLRQGERGMHPHMLRHAYASNMVANGCELKTLQDLLGHKSITTTERYLHIPNETQRSAAMKFGPRL